jgi:DNA-binding PadR family transcriptional regulator
MHGQAAFADDPYEASAREWWARRRVFMMSGRGHEHGRAGHHGRFPFGGGFGPWGGFGGSASFFGPGPRMGRGDVRAAILVLLSEGPRHGYQVIQDLTERTGGMWRPSPGSVYPTLQQLEDEGLVRSSESDGRRVYELTDAGRAEVQSRGDEPPPWEMSSGMEQVKAVGDEVQRLAAAFAQVVRTGNPSQFARARVIIAEARKGLYRLLAEDDEAADDSATD